jgi:hypothetical protein
MQRQIFHYNELKVNGLKVCSFYEEGPSFFFLGKCGQSFGTSFDIVQGKTK